MKKISASNIKDLVTKFSEKNLPKTEWTHQAHILVALWHNANYDFDTALLMVKDKIKAYNISVGTLNTDEAGYHETLTIFWMILTRQYLLRHPKLSFEVACHQFLHSEYASKTYPFEYYSRKILFSKKARKSWINGDIQPIGLLSNDYQLHNHFDLSDEAFIQQFTNCTLSPGLFSHEAHLRLAWIHLNREGVKVARKNISNQIINFVKHLGAQDKYNHTLTIAAVEIVHHFMQHTPRDNFFDFILASPRLKTNFKELIASHYSFDIFTSDAARKKYLEPDLVAFG